MPTHVKPYNLEKAQRMVRAAVRASQPRHDRWQTLENLYATGEAYSEVTAANVPGRLWDFYPELTLDKINLALPYINVILASVVANEPSWVVEPFVGGEPAELGAKLHEKLLRYFWRRQHVTPDMRDATQDMVVIGNGFVKVGWAFLEQEVERDFDDVLEEAVTLLEDDRLLADLAQTDPSDPEELLDRVQLTQRIAEQDEPFVEYVSPYDIFVPPDARRMWETRWVAQRMTLPIDELEDNPLLDGDVVPDGGDHFLGGEEVNPTLMDDDVELVTAEDPEVLRTATIYEFYDMRTRTMLVFQLDAEEPLYEGELPYSHRYPPFVHLRGYHPNGNAFWAFGELENIASIQTQLNEFVAVELDNARRSGNKYLARTQHLSKEAREALESDASDVVVPVNDNNVQLSDVVIALERKGTHPDTFKAKDDLIAAMQQVTGINDFQAGGTGADRMAATTAAVVDGVATLRAQQKVSQVEEAHAQVGQLMLLLMQEFLDKERVIRIAGTDGQAWVNVAPQDLVGEYRVQVEGGSTRAINPATRQQKALQLIQVLIPALAPLGFDPVPAFRSAVRDLGYDPDLLLQRAPMPPAAPGGAPVPGGPAPAGPPMPDGLPVQPPNPALASLEGMGGPPVPAADQGDLFL